MRCRTLPSMSPSPPPLDGDLRLDDATREATAEDFGHIVRRTPYAVLRPGSADDVATAIRWAAQQGRSFAAQGRRHSTFGRSQAQDGIVADMSMLRDVGAVDGDRVAVGAGATWREVLLVTLAHGMTPPVLTDYLDLSVGGTLVVGGVGGTTSSFGLQSDNVLDLELVTGEGQKLTCSASQNVEEFDTVRAGLGQVGVITRATLRLVAAPTSVRRFLLFYPDLASMLDDARRLSGDDRFDAVQGAIVPTPNAGFTYRLDAAAYVTRTPPNDDALLAGLSDDAAHRQATSLAYLEYLDRLAPLEAALRANGQWHLPHPWLTTFIGDSQVEPVVEAELTAIDPAADLGPLGQIVLSPTRRSAISSPLLPMPADDLCHAFNLVRLPATADAGEVTRLVEANRATYHRVKAAGGTLYPVSAFHLSPTQWREHFGPAFDRLSAAKQRFDPSRILTPGYDLLSPAEASCGVVRA